VHRFIIDPILYKTFGACKIISGLLMDSSFEVNDFSIVLSNNSIESNDMKISVQEKHQGI
jgi:hypothetical protein